jgi:hypothetical protein
MNKYIGEGLTICGHSVKQKGYGRQGLYLEFKEVQGEHYMQDVYPNVQEHFDFLLENDGFGQDEDGGLYTDGSGNGSYEKLYKDVVDALNDILKGREIEISEEEE